MEKKKVFVEIVMVRLFLILLLVFFHAFAIYGGAWIRKFTPPNIEVYFWLDWLSYSFMLETFVFISGLLFGIQETKRNMTVDDVLKKKGKRLILPSLIFSVTYFYCFQYKYGVEWITIYDWIIGTAHMWFLPMLFICFVIVSVFRETIKNHFIPVFIIIVFLALFSFLPLPLRLDKTIYYLPFFVVGYGIGNKHFNINISLFNSKKEVCALIIIFLIFFIGFTILNRYIKETKGEYSLYIKCVLYIIINGGKLIYSGLGVLMVYIAMYRIKDSGLTINRFWISLSECCFGVYLFQQFVLVYLYDYTLLPFHVNYICLPWLCFFIALLTSVLVTWALRQSKIGRKLI